MNRFIVFALFFLFVAFVVGPELHNPNFLSQGGSERIDLPAPSVDSDGAVVLKRRPDGHFYSDVTVNGVDIPMLVDTGATTIAMSREHALKAGLDVDDEDFTSTAETANGTAAVAPVVLDRVELGGIIVTNVPAAVLAMDLPVALLGNSFLSHMEDVTIRNDEMRLR